MKVLLLLSLAVLTNAQWVKEQENEGAYEGDMILTPEQKAEMESGEYSYATKKKNLWPKTGDYVVVPYVIEAALERAGGRTPIQKAVDDYKTSTCIRLVPRKSETAYITFYSGGGCSSPVGYHGSVNRISLPSGCWRHGTVLHEIAHSLGVYHEQSRPDRDDHLIIHWNKITPSTARNNFNKQSYTTVDSLNTEYDYESMMHYSGTAFGAGSVTIETKDKSKQNVIGQRRGFSSIDIIQLNKLYCGGSGGTTGSNCVDKNNACPTWKSYCNSNDYVKTNCLKSCGKC